MRSLSKSCFATAVVLGVMVLARTLAAAPVLPNPPTGDIAGTVSDSATGKPLPGVEVQAAVPLAVDTRTGNQILKQNDYHGAPTNTTPQILQQSIAGAARAPP